MNKKQLLKLGVPHDCVDVAIACLQADAGSSEKRRAKQVLPRLIAAPQEYLADPAYGPLAKAVLTDYEIRQEKGSVPDFPRGLGKSATDPGGSVKVEYAVWGRDLDAASHSQISAACQLPVARAAALMPDAHSGYGLPIGGVLACENAVVPYAVGVDIACRMKLTITDLPVDALERNDPAECRELDAALKKGTIFGTGGRWNRPQEHAVMDEDWSVTAVTREVRDKAWVQLGTSGSGNHFAEWGVVNLPTGFGQLGAGRYVALMSHSGSRGPGAAVCQRYSDIARRKLTHRFKEDPQLRHLAWLMMNDEDGQAYWSAMNLMGQYAAANHEVIHRNVTKLAGAKRLETIENHHNFAWKEIHQGKTLYVHRKGATPAAAGVLGVIPGNMADTAFIVRGKGEPKSLNSAAHGAGRCMSRTAAKKQFNWPEWREYLRRRNTRLLAGGLDEVPGAYKNIHSVMADQHDLVDVVGDFTPRIVLMCGDDSRAED